MIALRTQENPRQIISGRWFVALIVLLSAWALTDLGSAAWIQGKGQLGQWLMERHWHKGDDATLPWPGARTRPAARLYMPELAIDRLVVKGLATPNLAWGPGLHVGPAGHVVIAAHRDTHFAFLSRVEPGQRIELEHPAGVIRNWRVDDLRVVDSRDTEIDLNAPGPQLTLVTCWPFNTLETGGPLRLVVRARPVADPGGGASI